MCTKFDDFRRNIEVTSSTRYLYGNFLSYDSTDHAYIYARIYDFSYVRKFSECWIALRTQEFAHANSRTETGFHELSWITRLVRRANVRYHAKCCADRSNRCRDIVIFKLLGWQPPPSWISSDRKFVTDQTVTRAELRHRAKFRWNRCNCGRDMAIFRFFKMAAASMLDFWNKVLTAGRIISVELRRLSKFRGDWSNRCGDISILDFSRWWHPPSWIFKILHF